MNLETESCDFQVLMFDTISGRTCLHYAAYYGHSSCLKAILSAAQSSPVAASWFALFCLTIDFDVMLFFFYLFLVLSVFKYGPGGLHGLWILEMERVRRHCTWRLVRDGLNVYIFCWTVELLFVLQPVDMGNDLWKSGSNDWIWWVFLFCFVS